MTTGISIGKDRIVWDTFKSGQNWAYNLKKILKQFLQRISLYLKAIQEHEVKVKANDIHF